METGSTMTDKTTDSIVTAVITDKNVTPITTDAIVTIWKLAVLWQVRALLKVMATDSIVTAEA